MICPPITHMIEMLEKSGIEYFKISQEFFSISPIFPSDIRERKVVFWFYDGRNTYYPLSFNQLYKKVLEVCNGNASTARPTGA